MKFPSSALSSPSPLRYDSKLPRLPLPSSISIKDQLEATIPPMKQPDGYVPGHHEVIAEALRPDADRRNLAISHDGKSITFDTLSRSNFSNTPDLKVTIEIAEDPQRSREKWVNKCIVHRPGLGSIMAAYFDVPARTSPLPSQYAALNPRQQSSAERARSQRARAMAALMPSREERIHREHEIKSKEQRDAEVRALTSKRSAGQGFQPREMDHAGYLLRRAVDKRVADQNDPGPGRLRSLYASIIEARENLKRGNVVSDIKETNHGSTRRMRTAREIASLLINEGIPEQVRSAASAKTLGAGNCGENSNLLAHAHAAKLQSGERVVNVSGTNFDHAFTELRTGRVVRRSEFIVATTNSGHTVGIVNDGVNASLGADGRVTLSENADVIDLGENSTIVEIGGALLICKTGNQLVLVGDDVDLTSVANMVVTRDDEGTLVGIYDNGNNIKFDDEGNVVGWKREAPRIRFSKEAEVARIGSDQRTLAIYDRRPVYRKDDNMKNTDEIIGYSQHIVIVGNEGSIGGDSWGEGPAFFTEDGAFTDDPLSLTVNYDYDSASGLAASENFSNLAQVLAESRDWQDYIKERLEHHDATGYELPKEFVWAPTGVLSDEFLSRTSMEMGLTVPEEDHALNLQKLLREIEKVGYRRKGGVAIRDAAKQTGSYHDLTNEILATGVSLNTTEASVREAVEKAPSIIEAAKRLSR